MKDTKNKYVNTNKNIKLSDSSIKPFFTSFIYIAKDILRKPSTYILFVFSIIIPFIFLLLPILINDRSSQEFLSLFNLFFTIYISSLIVLSGLFGVIKTLNVFIDPQSNGIEILVVSKPITRNQIIFSRFLFLFTTAIIFSLFQLIFYLIGVSVNSVWNEIYGSSIIVFSSFLSPLLSFIIFGAIAALFGLRFSGKIARIAPTFMLLLFAMLPQAINMIAMPLYHPISSRFNAETNNVTKKIQEQNNDVDPNNDIHFYSSKYGETNILDNNVSDEFVISFSNNYLNQLSENNFYFDLSLRIQNNDYESLYLHYNSQNYGPSDREVIYLSNAKYDNDSSSQPLRMKDFPSWDPEVDNFGSSSSTSKSKPTEAQYNSWLTKTKIQLDNNKSNFIDAIASIFENSLSLNSLGGLVFLDYINPINAIQSLSLLNSIKLQQPDQYYGVQLLYNYNYDMKATKASELAPDSKVIELQTNVKNFLDENLIKYAIKDGIFIIEDSAWYSIPSSERKQLQAQYYLLNDEYDKYCWLNKRGDEQVFSIYNPTQTDPTWALALLWLSITSFAIAYIIFSYIRKDFK